eukprot:CAMPEP_0171319896 /NCGR_PEP_ID=MMETSP0816-20121228/100116_1 /TAXON_ID=420281 /ORGANISM="Proboscia inermis, Strain CCAP1064/1" /LENGTH=118 /DNA_ID=CAMNT_0011816103 /DNA_START=75 /DNA_END=431 /DNA_ORIENTATION=+
MYNDDNYAEASEMCQQIYAGSGKCEKNLEAGYGNGPYYPSTDACEYIEKVMPGLESLYNRKSGNTHYAPYAIFFATSSFFLGAYVAFLRKKLGHKNPFSRSNISIDSTGLSPQGPRIV